MLEYWNDELKKMTFLHLIPGKRDVTITQLSIFSLSCSLSEPEAQNPIFLPSETFFYFTGASVSLFQHSNCERSELLVLILLHMVI